MDNKYITFEDYLRNELTPGKAKDFLSSLEENPHLKEEFDGYKEMRAVLVKRFNVKDDKELLQHLEKFGDKYFKGRDEKENKKIGSSFRSFRWVNRMAACFLILFGVLWGFKMQVQDTYSTDLLVQNAKVSIIEKSRGGTNKKQDENDKIDASKAYLKQLNQLFVEGDYVELLRMNEMDLLTDSDKIKAGMILAESYIQLNDFDKSIKLCKTLLLKTKGEVASKIEFVLARAYIGAGDKEKGIEALEQMSQGDTDMKKSATDLLKDLKSFRHWLASF